MPRLGPAAHNKVIDRLQAEQSQNEVARQFNVQQSTIYLLWLKIEVVGHASLVQPMIGISWCSINVIEQLLMLVSRVYGEFPPRQSATGFAKAEIRPIRPYVGPVLTQVHRRARVRWCHTLRNWR